MATRIRKPRHFAAELRRIGQDLLGEARRGLQDSGVEAAHQTRKRCKELRALCRLLRPADKQAQRRFNATVRDAARQLAGPRDAESRVECFDAVAASEPELLSSVKLSALRDPLVAESAREAASSAGEGRDSVGRACRLLEDAAAQLDDWPDRVRLGDLLGGAERTYRRGREAFEACGEAPTTARLHEWRKRVKYGWYHLRFLQHASRSALRPWKHRLHDLADALGDDHDLALLVDHLRASEGLDQDPLERFVRVAEGVRVDLQRRALRLGARLYAQEPEEHTGRLRCYVEAWRRYGRELPAGGIGAVTGD